MSRDLPMANIRREPCGGWVIVLFMVVPFVIGCVDRMCQLFLSECVFFQLSFLALSLWIFYLSLLVGDKFFQSDDKWNCHLVIRIR